MATQQSQTTGDNGSSLTSDLWRPRAPAQLASPTCHLKPVFQNGYAPLSYVINHGWLHAINHGWRVDYRPRSGSTSRWTWLLSTSCGSGTRMTGVTPTPSTCRWITWAVSRSSAHFTSSSAHSSQERGESGGGDFSSRGGHCCTPTSSLHAVLYLLLFICIQYK